ncbi:hypothetical protein EV426DRAFT_711482 [Tirmania nivea]|nr:hypothetical protein EV426DRAFT_711482 [Tirmania nivea]
MGEPRGDDGDNGSSVTLTVTVTLSETEDSDSMSSLLSSEWDSEDDEVDHEREMLWKLRTLRAILAKRYLRERGGTHQFQNPSTGEMRSLGDFHMTGFGISSG